MIRKALKGIFALMPLVVGKNQELDLEGLKENIAAYEQAGFDGYVAFGCMGEFYATSEQEFNRVVDVAVGASNKIACVFGTTWHNTEECLRRTKYAEQAGADGVMIGPPYLIPCTEEDVFEHYRIVNEAIDDIQVMAYNNPVSFRFNMTPKLWDRLMRLESIKALKESNGDLLHRIAVIKHICKKINVFSGYEGWLLDDTIHGANSLVSVCGPGAPKAAIAYYRACISGDISKAVQLNHAFVDMGSECTDNNEAAWLKACAEIGGFKAGPPRSPYAPISSEVRKRLERFVEIANNLV
jgi:4-hydroxy-tetrahydrodipicolinate synthase